jgi:hypothetical protein
VSIEHPVGVVCWTTDPVEGIKDARDFGIEGPFVRHAVDTKER